AIYGDEYKNEARGKRFAQDKKNAARRILGKIESQVSAPAAVAPKEEALAAAQLVKTETIEAKAAEAEKTAPLVEAKVTEEAQPVETKKPEAPVAPVIQPAPVVTPVDTEKIQELTKEKEALAQQVAEYENKLNLEEKAAAEIRKELEKAYQPVTQIRGQSIAQIRGVTVDERFSVKDIPYVSGLNANTIRTYLWINNRTLNALPGAGIKSVLGMPKDDGGYREFGLSAGPTINGIISGRDSHYIKELKNNPAVLFIVLDNEPNLHKFWGYNKDTYYKDLNKAAKKIHEIDPSRIVAYVHGNMLDAKTVEMLADVDVFGLNIYAWDNLKGVIGRWENLCKTLGRNIPMFISESGTDSYYTDPKTNKEREDQAGQRKADENIVRSVYAYKNSNCLGITLMSLRDNPGKKGTTSAGFPYDNRARENALGLLKKNYEQKEAYAGVRDEFGKAALTEVTEADAAAVAGLKEKLAQVEARMAELKAQMTKQEAALGETEEKLKPAAAAPVIAQEPVKVKLSDTEKINLALANISDEIDRLERKENLLSSFPTDSSLNSAAFTYDTAVNVIRLVNDDELKKADKGLAVIARLHAKQDEMCGLYNAYSILSGQSFEKQADAGANAWMILAISHYTYRTGDTKYLPLAQKIADYLFFLQDNDPAHVDSFGAIRVNCGKDESGQWISATYFSTENNISAYAAFKALYNVLPDGKYKAAYEKIEGWLKKTVYTFYPEKKVWTPLNLFGFRPIQLGNEIKILNMRAKKIWQQKYFSAGYDEKKGWDKTVASDVGLWMIMAYGPQDFEKTFKVSARKVYATIKDRCTLSSGLLDYTDENGRLKIGREEMGSGEWTPFAGQVANVLGIRGDAKGSLSAVNKLKDKEGFLPYASKEFQPTGFGWYTPSGGALISRLWYDLTLAKENPFTLEKESAGKTKKPVSSVEEFDKYSYNYREDLDIKRVKIAILEDLRYPSRLIEQFRQVEDPRPGVDLLKAGLGFGWMSGSPFHNFGLGSKSSLMLNGGGIFGDAAQVGFTIQDISTNAGGLFLPAAGLTIPDKLLEIFNELNIMQDIKEKGAIIYSAVPETNLLPEVSVFSGNRLLQASALGKFKVGLEKNVVEFEDKDGNIVPKRLFNVKQPLEDLFGKDYPAVVILSESHKSAFYEATYSPVPGYTYWAVCRGEYHYIYRFNYSTNRFEPLSRQRMFTPETAKFCRDAQWWPLGYNPDRSEPRMSPIDSFDKSLGQLETSLNGRLKGWGVTVKNVDGKVTPLATLKGLKIAYEVPTTIPYFSVYFVPETGEVIVPGVKNSLAHIAFKSGIGIEFEGVNVPAAYGFIVSEAGIFYVYSLEELEKLPVVKLSEDYEIIFEGGKKITFAKGATVTLQKPFAQEVTLSDGRTVLIPAVVEYSQNKKAEAASVTIEKDGKLVYKDSEPFGSRRQKTDWQENESFWRGWMEKYNEEDWGWVKEFNAKIAPTLNIPKIKVEKIKKPMIKGDSLSAEGYKLTVRAAYPGSAEKNVFEKSFNISFGDILKISSKKSHIEVDEAGHMKPIEIKDDEKKDVEKIFFRDLLRKQAIKDVKGELPSQELFFEYVYYPEDGWQRVVSWGSNLEDLYKKRDGYNGFGVGFIYGEGVRVISEEESPYVKRLRDLSAAELELQKIKKEFSSKGVLYTFDKEGVAVPLNYRNDAGKIEVTPDADQMLVLGGANEKFTVVEIGLKGIELRKISLLVYNLPDGKAKFIKPEELAQNYAEYYELYKNGARIMRCGVDGKNELRFYIASTVDKTKIEEILGEVKTREDMPEAVM
ncbi:MAG: hypothetical protein WC357_04970, partial [Candidatus Omnitrophota bacterium]